MTNEEAVKKLMSLLEGGKSGKTPVKDFKTALLRSLSEDPSNDVRVEYARILRDLRLMATAINYKINCDGCDDSLKRKASALMEKINTLIKVKFESPTPKIYGDDSFRKYCFRDGSEATFENYDQVKNTVMETMLLNQINELNVLISEGESLLLRLENDLWEFNDGIEEIDPSKELKTENDESDNSKHLEEQNQIDNIINGDNV